MMTRLRDCIECARKGRDKAAQWVAWFNNTAGYVCLCDGCLVEQRKQWANTENEIVYAYPIARDYSPHYHPKALQ